MEPTYTYIVRQLQLHSIPNKAKELQRFFKTGPGEYGAGDKFAGITMPQVRKIVKQNYQLALTDVVKLIHHPIHEYRMTGLLILVEKYSRTKSSEKRSQLYKLYLENTEQINNWDLVDVTAHKIVGKHLLDKSRKQLYQLAKSNNLWERRIAIISTFTFINKGDFQDTLKIAKILLHDQHDLIHKAVGWMLREIGKKDQKIEEDFLKEHYNTMPRTMLRYAIEKFSEKLRKKYLKGTV